MNMLWGWEPDGDHYSQSALNPGIRGEEAADGEPDNGLAQHLRSN